MNRFELLIKAVDQLRGKKRLGEILMNKYQLTQGELDEALAIQARDPLLRRLGYILVEKGFITHSEMMEALSDQLDVCVPFDGNARETPSDS